MCRQVKAACQEVSMQNQDTNSLRRIHIVELEDPCAIYKEGLSSATFEWLMAQHLQMHLKRVC
jgi:hypothetical protein